MEWDCTFSRPLYRHSWSPDRWQGCLPPTHNPRLRLLLREFPGKNLNNFFGQLYRFFLAPSQKASQLANEARERFNLLLARESPTVHRPSSRLHPRRPGRSRSCRRSRLTRAGFPILAGWRAGQFSWLSLELQLMETWKTVWVQRSGWMLTAQMTFAKSTRVLRSKPILHKFNFLSPNSKIKM